MEIFYDGENLLGMVIIPPKEKTILFPLLEVIFPNRDELLSDYYSQVILLPEGFWHWSTEDQFTWVLTRGWKDRIQ